MYFFFFSSIILHSSFHPHRSSSPILAFIIFLFKSFRSRISLRSSRIHVTLSVEKFLSKIFHHAFPAIEMNYQCWKGQLERFSRRLIYSQTDIHPPSAILWLAEIPMKTIRFTRIFVVPSFLRSFSLDYSAENNRSTNFSFLENPSWIGVFFFIWRSEGGAHQMPRFHRSRANNFKY